MVGCAIGPDRARLLRVVVITAPAPGGRTHLQVAAAALAGGCGAVQLRDKGMEDREFLEVASRVRGMCREQHALFFVNDRVDVAALVKADGVHLGVADLGVEQARALLPAGTLIGFSPEGVEEARAAVMAGADYLGVGPLFGTSSKPDAGDAIGLERLAAYCRMGIAPVIAVGGIDAGNAGLAIEAGASGVAVLFAVARAPDMEEAARRIVDAVEQSTLAKGGGKR